MTSTLHDLDFRRFLVMASMAITFSSFADSTDPAATPGGVPVPDSEITARVADDYRQRMRERDVDGMAPILAEDAFFIDPTVEALGMPLASGIRGRGAILAEIRSWDLSEISWTSELRFTSAGHDVLFATVETPQMAPFPFLNILQVDEGRVVERIDYGDYIGATARTERGEADDETRLLVSIADRYLEAYCRDVDAMAALLAEDAEFHDPTAAILGPGMGGEPIYGRQAIADWFRAATTGVESVTVERIGSLVSKHRVVWVVRSRVELDPARAPQGFPQVFEAPLVIVLEIRDGKVVRHHDYWDAESFRRAWTRPPGL